MQPVQSRTAILEGLATHYLEAGEGFPVVLLHSGEFGGAAELSWEFTIPILAEHFRVIAPDWLGFGESAKIFSFDDMTELRLRQVALLLRKLGVESAHFIGNSMGGGLLARAAVASPPAFPIAKMILVGAGGFAPLNEARRILNTYDGTRDHMKRIVETVLACSPLRGDDSYIARRHRLSLAPGAWECTAAARFRRPSAAPREKHEPDYRAISRPVLIVAGGKDPLREPGYGGALQRDIAGSELAVIPEAGHFPHIDCPERFNRLALQFLLR
jgi:pimeloyl-ACP methyl ester carboxylesterase